MFPKYRAPQGFTFDPAFSLPYITNPPDDDISNISDDVILCAAIYTDDAMLYFKHNQVCDWFL